MRIARRSADPFLRLLTATATLWVLGQVFINVGYVVGLLPVTGLQLPLISAGGTSTATTLLMIGVITNAARHEPEAVAALRAGRDDRVNRLLRLPLPEPYVPTRLEAAARPAAHAAASRQPPSRSRKPRPSREGQAAEGQAEARTHAGRGRRRRTTPGGRPAGAALRASWRPSTRNRAVGLAHWKVSVTGEHRGEERSDRYRWSSPVAAPRGTSNPRWPSPTP